MILTLKQIRGFLLIHIGFLFEIYGIRESSFFGFRRVYSIKISEVIFMLFFRQKVIVVIISKRIDFHFIQILFLVNEI